MRMIIEVGEVPDTGEISLGSLNLQHHGCGRLTQTRDQLNPHWTLRCEGCGIKVVIGKAGMYEIERTAIDQAVERDISGHLVGGDGGMECIAVPRHPG